MNVERRGRLNLEDDRGLMMTFVNGNMFYEEGGVYANEPHYRAGVAARKLDPAEHVASCPRCGQRFAATKGSSPKRNRDRHFDGDAGVPSICRDNGAT